MPTAKPPVGLYLSPCFIVPFAGVPMCARSRVHDSGRRRGQRRSGVAVKSRTAMTVRAAAGTRRRARCASRHPARDCRGPVLPHVIRISRLRGSRSHPAAAGARRAPVAPASRPRAAAMAASLRLRRSAALAQRRVRHDGHRVLAHPRQQIPFDAALLQVIEHLIRRAVRTAGQRDKCGHRRAIEIRHAPAHDLAGRAAAARTHRRFRRAGCAPASAADRDRSGRCASRRRLRSHAATADFRPALCGYTLLTTNTSSRRPAIASPTISSAPPSPYISAVSISVMPRSRPSRSAATSRAALARRSPIRHVPCPSTGTLVPSGSAVVADRAGGRLVIPERVGSMRGL